MSSHLPVDPTDPNRGGIPLDDFPEFVRLMTARNALPDDGGRFALIFDDPFRVGDLPPDAREALERAAEAAGIPRAAALMDVRDVLSRHATLNAIPPELAARLRTLGAMVVPHTPNDQDLRDMIQRIAPESAEPVMNFDDTGDLPEPWARPAREIAPRVPALGETWPGQHEHHRHHDLMVAEHATTGVYRDPVSGRTFPPGQAMKRDPNRKERRRLETWRRTGKAPR